MNHYEELQRQVVSVLACETMNMDVEKLELKQAIEVVLSRILYFLRMVEQDSGNELLENGIPTCITEFLHDVFVLKPELNFDDKDILNVMQRVTSKIGHGTRSRSGKLKPVLEELRRRTKYTLWSWSVRDS